MFRRVERAGILLAPFPHACGDVPRIYNGVEVDDHFSPRLWGCSEDQGRAGGMAVLFPTPVGMFRATSCARSAPAPFPHACGDVPPLLTARDLADAFSPRLWGCSASPRPHRGPRGLFPTPVGMFRESGPTATASSPFPHACGDVPGAHGNARPPSLFSPRLWGCSAKCLKSLSALLLFPTPVGMFRRLFQRYGRPYTFPHACGDVPARRHHLGRCIFFSPRLWGCSARQQHGSLRRVLFPTPVGMFRSPPRPSGSTTPFPHACGDVPSLAIAAASAASFSPRLWGCSVFSPCLF